MRVSKIVTTVAVLLALIGQTSAGRAQSTSSPAHSSAQDKRPNLPRAYFDRHDISPEEASERVEKDQRWSHFLSRPLNDPGTPNNAIQVDIDIIWHVLGDSSNIPVGDSVAIVVGTVSKSKGFITAHKTGVYSEYSVEVTEILKDDPEFPLQVGKTIRVTQTGAAVVFPSGSVAHVYVRGRGIPQFGQNIVLFLGQHPDAHERDYGILRVYEIDKGIILPLDSAADYRGMNANEFLDMLRGKIRLATRGNL